MSLSDDDEETSASAAPNGQTTITERDIVFTCRRCSGELVVDREGEGLEVPCPHCGLPLIIPAFQSRPAIGAVPMPGKVLPPKQTYDFAGFSGDQLGRRVEELRHQLKENRSQDTELRGHVNRATMELHRFQLRLQKLAERQAEIEAEIGAAREYLPLATPEEGSGAAPA